MELLSPFLLQLKVSLAPQMLPMSLTKQTRSYVDTQDATNGKRDGCVLHDEKYQSHKDTYEKHHDKEVVEEGLN